MKTLNDSITEVRSTFYDEIIHATAVDFWCNDEDEGYVAAYVYDTGKVQWRDESYKTCEKLQEEVNNVLVSQTFLNTLL